MQPACLHINQWSHSNHIHESTIAEQSRILINITSFCSCQWQKHPAVQRSQGALMRRSPNSEPFWKHSDAPQHTALSHQTLHPPSFLSREGGWAQKTNSTGNQLVQPSPVLNLLSHDGGCRPVRIKYPNSEPLSFFFSVLFFFFFLALCFLFPFCPWSSPKEGPLPQLAEGHGNAKCNQ